MPDILFKIVLSARDYKYVSSEGWDWALVLVVVLFFIGAEFFAHLDNKNNRK